MSQQAPVVTDLPAKNFLSRVPVRKTAAVALAAAAVAGVVVAFKGQFNVDVETVDAPED